MALPNPGLNRGNSYTFTSDEEYTWKTVFRNHGSFFTYGIPYLIEAPQYAVLKSARRNRFQEKSFSKLELFTYW